MTVIAKKEINFDKLLFRLKPNCEDITKADKHGRRRREADPKNLRAEISDII